MQILQKIGVKSNLNISIPQFNYIQFSSRSTVYSNFLGIKNVIIQTVIINGSSLKKLTVYWGDKTKTQMPLKRGIVGGGAD